MLKKVAHLVTTMYNRVYKAPDSDRTAKVVDLVPAGLLQIFPVPCKTN